MSNFEEKFKNWQEKMNKKSDKEKHYYALSVSFFVTAIVTFFVVSNWYFTLMGDNFDTSFFTQMEDGMKNQYSTIKKNYEKVSQLKEKISENFVDISTVVNQSTIPATTTQINK